MKAGIGQILLATLFVGLAGCGGDDSASPSPPVATASPSPTPSPSPGPPKIQSIDTVQDRLSAIDDLQVYRVDYTVSPANADQSRLVLRSGNEDVVSIAQDGSITTNGVGSTNIEFVDNGVVLATVPIDVRPVRLFALGNSLTADYRPTTEFVELAATQSITIQSDWHIKCGSNLRAIIAAPSETCVSQRFESYPAALESGQFDIITIQPHRSPNAAAEIDAIAEMVAQIRNSPNRNARIYVYYAWTENTADPLAQFGYSSAWFAPYSPLERLISMNDDFVVHMKETLQERQVSVDGYIPAGRAFERVHGTAGRNLISGISGAGELYRDRLHANNIGSFVAGATVLATLFPDVRFTNTGGSAYGPRSSRERDLPDTTRRDLLNVSLRAARNEGN